jgi:hypothetical protein
VNSLPVAPVTTSGSSCGTGVVRVSATSTTTGAAIDWYSAATSGTLILSNSANLDSFLTATKTFYAQSRIATTGCVSKTRSSAVATVNALPVASSSLTGTTSICPIVGTTTATTYTCTAVTSAASYFWTIPPTAVIDSGSNGLKIKVRFTAASSNDSIMVQAVSTAGCRGAKKVLKLVTTGCATIARNSGLPVTGTQKSELLIYPNPTHDVFYMQSTAGKAGTSVRVNITDASGRKVKSFVTLNSSKNSFGNDLIPGIYFIEVTGEGISYRTKLVKY